MHGKIDWNHGKFNEKLWNNRWTLWVNQCTPWKNRVKQWKNRWTMQMVNFSSKIQQCFCSKMKQIAGKSAPDGKTNKKTRIILPKNATFLYKLQAASRGVQFNTRSLEAGAGHRSELKEPLTLGFTGQTWQMTWLSLWLAIWPRLWILLCSNLNIWGRLPESHDRRKRHGRVQRLCCFCEDPVERHPRICHCGRHARDERRRHGFFPFCLLNIFLCGWTFSCQLALVQVSLE